MGNMVLCHDPHSPMNLPYMMVPFNKSFYAPVVKYNALEIDNFLQYLMVEVGDFRWKVIKFTDEELFEITLRKLRN